MFYIVYLHLLINLLLLLWKKPSFTLFRDLEQHYHSSVACPCSQISIKYQSFINIQPRFHALCSSDFISTSWIIYLYGDGNLVDQYDPTDFYYSAVAQFQVLASFCQLSRKAVNDSLLQLNSSYFINAPLLSTDIFNQRLETNLDLFQTSIPNSFINILSLIRETTGTNMILNTLSTNWMFTDFLPPYSFGVTLTEPRTYDECNCGLSSTCVHSSRGMFSGCYPIEALLQASLGCFYDQECIDPSHTFKALNITYLNTSRFTLNMTIEMLVNELMVEEYTRTISYEKYFNACAPGIMQLFLHG